MEFSVVASQNISSIMAEITSTQGGQEIEGLTLPQELMDGELFKEQPALGCLRGEAKSYSFTLERSPLPQKLTDYLEDINRPQQKIIESKNKNHHLSFKESLTRTKELKVIEPHAAGLGGNRNEKGDVESKTQALVKHVLEKAILPKSASQLKDTPALKQQQNLAKSLEQKVQNQLTERGGTEAGLERGQ